MSQLEDGASANSTDSEPSNLTPLGIFDTYSKEMFSKHAITR